MATYNGEKYLQEQLDSFLNQTVLPNELIVVDDCSTDNTVAILNSFKINAPFEVNIYINEKNIGGSMYNGYAQNFSKAIEKCSGDYIFFSDQDDVWFKEKIETHINIYKNKPEVKYIYNVAKRVSSDLSSMISEEASDYCRYLKKPIFGCCHSGKRDFLKKYWPIPKQVAHDWWYVACTELENNFYFCHQTLQLYRTHSSQVTFRNNIKSNPFQKLFSSISKFINNDDIKHINSEIQMWEPRLNAIKQYWSKFITEEEFPEFYHKSLFHYKCYKLRLEYINEMNFFKRLVNITKNFNVVYKEAASGSPITKAFRDLVNLYKK